MTYLSQNNSVEKNVGPFEFGKVLGSQKYENMGVSAM
jgi:hypothetical protein